MTRPDALYEPAALAKGWIKTDAGWVHPIYDKPELDEPFKTARDVCAYEQVGPDYEVIE